MSSGSPRYAVGANIAMVAMMSFLLGMFLMLGVQKFLQHDQFYMLGLLLAPLFVFAAVLNAHRIFKAVP